jgi:hypothetical protein
LKIRGDGWPSVYFATILHQYVEIFWHNVCTYFVGTYVESDDNGSLICIICTQLLQFISLCLWLEQRKKVNTDFSKLRKWTKGTNIFEKDYLFVPIHDNLHWSLAVICFPGADDGGSGSECCIIHLDSMTHGHNSQAVFRLLRRSVEIFLLCIHMVPTCLTFKINGIICIGLGKYD